MKTNKKTRLVVIGNGMAGIRTIEELLKMSPDEFEITVFGAEPQPNYNRILLSPVLSGEMKFADTVLNDWGWYKEHNITLHAGKLVTRIDRLHCVVESEDGLAIPYDRLLIATGSNPIMLPLFCARRLAKGIDESASRARIQANHLIYSGCSG